MRPRTAQEIRPVRTAREREAALALRRRVFCDEQGVDPDLEVDGRDGDAQHFVAIRDGAVIGACRLLFDGPAAKLGRLVVEREDRGQGVATRIIDAAVAAARDAGAQRVALNAQTVAVGLYARAGFVARGEPFEEAGIQHVRMELDVRA